MEHEPVSEAGISRKPILRWSLSAKLIVVLLALAILPMAATSYYNLTRGQDAVARVARENLIELSRSTGHRIELLLTENQRTSATLAGEPLAVLGQLAGGLGRELRNPLGAIKSAAYFLNMAPEEPELEVKETLSI